MEEENGKKAGGGGYYKGGNFAEVTDRILAARMVGQMQLHLVQHHQGLHARMGNGLCIETKKM